MTTTAAGCITRAEELLRTTLAACKTFQTWVGAATAAEAAEHIYLEALPPDDVYSDRVELDRLKARRPFAQIWTSDSDGFRIESIGSPCTIAPGGTMYIRLEQDVPADIAHDYAEVDRLFKNNIGLVLHSGDNSNPGFVELCRTAGYRDWRTITVAGWTRTHENEIPTLGDAQMCEIRIEWGGVG